MIGDRMTGLVGDSVGLIKEEKEHEALEFEHFRRMLIAALTGSDPHDEDGSTHLDYDLFLRSLDEFLNDDPDWRVTATQVNAGLRPVDAVKFLEITRRWVRGGSRHFRREEWTEFFTRILGLLRGT